MAARVVQVAEAVTNDINDSTSLSQTVTATRTTRALSKLPDLVDPASLPIHVMPAGRVVALNDRTPESIRNYVVDVKFSQKAEADSEGNVANDVPDELLELAEEIETIFLGKKDTELGVWCIASTTEPLIEETDNEILMTITITVSLEFREIR
jgi:hypothetical protein